MKKIGDAIRATFQIGDNKNISGVIGGESSRKRFNCWSSVFFHVEDHSNIYGKTNKGETISLINCLGNMTNHHRDNSSSYESEIYSHIMILGAENLYPEEKNIKSISFEVANPLKLLRNFNSFGYVNFPGQELIESLNNQENTPEFKASNNPIIAYFDGEFEIFRQETRLGTISARNLVSGGMFGNAEGVEIKNKVVVKIDFHEEVDLQEAFKKGNLVSKFLRFIGGQGLYFEEIKLLKSNDNEGFCVHHDSHDWGSESANDHYSDTIVDLSSKVFCSVLKSWFDKEDRETVRNSFYSSYFRDTYSPNRLITAANMFDIFPCESDQLKKQVTPEAELLLNELKIKIKSDFKENIHIKDSLLQSIGFLKRRNLKDRVLERAQIVRDQLGDGIVNDLDVAIKYGIKCRNYFVHGSEDRKLSPENCFEFQCLFINTFEYIYAMSELLDCGWEPDKYFSRSRHYIKGLEREIEFGLRKLIAIVN